MNNLKIECPKCKHNLKWEDTYDCDGSIIDGYITEYQDWVCPNCDKIYYVNLTVTINETSITNINIEENGDWAEYVEPQDFVGTSF